jgi:hypothetical protein
MNSLNDTLYGPLGKNYCFYFYILSVIGFISLLFVVISALFIGVYKKKGFDFYVQAFTLAVVYGMVYFQNRLLFNMCESV